MVLNEILYFLQESPVHIPVEDVPVYVPKRPQPPVYLPGEAPFLETTAIPFPEVFPMFLILFIGLIAWVVLIRITRIRSMIVIMGGTLTIISISLIMEWVSNFIGISMIILCIIPILLEQKEALLANVPSVKISQFEFKRR